MKILTRLSKEGSSAEEPLNIPLSDYSSDEGDTSTSSSEDEAGKDSMAEMEGPCCSSLKVPPSSPVLPQKFKGNKKGKKQSRTPTRPYRRRSRSAHRIVLDIPTAEPASDFFDFTSDEDSPSATAAVPPWGGHPMAVSDTEHTVKRNFRRRHKCRESDRIRKLTALGCETQYLMPPELIVRSAASRYQSEEDEDDRHKMAMSIIKEFPPIINKERSWQGFNRADRHRDLMKAISPDHFQSHSTALSLKRSIWTGTQSDGYVNETIYSNSRPLSWGVPPVLVKSSYFDNEALLTACSQKLAAWKDEKRSMKEKHHKSMSRLQAAAAAAAAAGSSSSNKENRSSGSGPPARLKLSLSEQYSAAGKSSRQGSDKKTADGETTTSGIAKVRRKTRSTLNKIVEKAELITHLSRSARSSGTHSRRISAAAGFLGTTTTSSSTNNNNNGSPRKATSTSNLLAGTTSPATPLLVSSQSLRTPIHDQLSAPTRSGHRFRTGGIVVTAAQPLPRQRRAHLRSGIAGAAGSRNSPTKLPTPTTIDIQLTTLCSETESEKNLKIISSKKHKKRIAGGTGSRDKSSIKILT